MAKEFSDYEKELLRMLFEQGHIKFGAFKLKMHEESPDAPLSPIYLNLREMSEEILFQIGNLLSSLCVREGIKHDHVVGIPKAGDPIADCLCKASGSHKIWIEKDESGEKRRITSKMRGQFIKGDIALLADDLITKADTKLEAIDGVEKNGLVVTHLLVLFDREQGGEEAMKAAGKTLVALIKLSDALDFYVEEGMITEEKVQEIRNYQHAVEDYFASKNK